MSAKLVVIMRAAAKKVLKARSLAIDCYIVLGIIYKDNGKENGSYDDQ